MPPPRGWAEPPGAGGGRGCSGRSWSTRLGARSPGRPGGAAAGSTAPLVSWGSRVPPVQAKKWNTGSQAPGVRGASVCACVCVIARGGAVRPLSLRYCPMEAAEGARGSPSPPRGPSRVPSAPPARVEARCGREAVTPALARPCVPGWLGRGRSPRREGALGAQVGPLPGAPGPRRAGGLPRGVSRDAGAAPRAPRGLLPRRRRRAGSSDLWGGIRDLFARRERLEAAAVPSGPRSTAGVDCGG